MKYKAIKKMRRKGELSRFIGLMFFISALGTALLPAARLAPTVLGPHDQALKEFEDKLETLRQQLKIPGMAAGVLKNQQLVWAKGFGYADVENRIGAAIDTPWHIASVAKTFAAVIILQLVEEGKLSLDDPLEKFGIRTKSDGIVRVRHILTHTSERRPGSFFRYSGRLWEHLARVIKEASGKTYKENLIERIIKRLELSDTAPNKESESETYAFEDVRNRLSVPYRMDQSFNLARSKYGLGFYAAGGTFTSLRDMAKYDAALDNNLLLKPETKRLMFTPFSSTNGKIFPHGLGWFTQFFHDTTLIWHFGWHPDHASALIIKVPERNLTFMVFANSDKLSQPFNLLRGNVLNSPAALLFLKTIVFPDKEIPELAAREARAADIILKTSGRKPVISPFQKGLLIFFLLVFLSAPLFWAAAWIARKHLGKKGASVPYKASLGSGISRVYAFLSVMACILFYGALLRAPFLTYWPELPGWIDGLSPAENFFLALPTLLALLSPGLVVFTVWIWVEKYWTLLERLHHTGLVVCMIGYVLQLDRWHLVGFSYYWNYLIR